MALFRQHLPLSLTLDGTFPRRRLGDATGLVLIRLTSGPPLRRHWQAFSGDEMDFAGMLDDLASDFESLLWQKAGKHEAWEDLAAGGDVYWARRERRKISQTGQRDVAGQTWGYR